MRSISPRPIATQQINLDRPPVLAMRGITKRFPGVLALNNVDLDAFPGEVHALVGENGAGKSTLMKILAGVYQPDVGEFEVGGEVVRFTHPRQAQAAGVSIIYQEFNLLPERTVAQNIFVGREPTKGFVVDTGRMEEETAGLLADLGVSRAITPRTIVGWLSVAQQQTVEIAKALSFDACILMMDEPTAALSPHEVEGLFERVRTLQERGLAILYISHRLEEIMALSQRVTVLKDGQRVGTVPTAEMTTGKLVSMMVGRELDHYYPPRATPDEGGAPAS